MVHQKAISVKLDSDVYLMLETEAVIGSLKRNRLINEAIKTYISIIHTRRKMTVGKLTQAEMLDILLEVAATAGRRTI